MTRYCNSWFNKLMLFHKIVWSICWR
jgi:hypothetical protein